MKLIKSFLLVLFIQTLLFAQYVPYRIRMPDSTYSAQLRGKTGTRTEGIIINGTYSNTSRAHVFKVMVTGQYDLYFDPNGGTNYIKDTGWSGEYGKTIVGSDYESWVGGGSVTINGGTADEITITNDGGLLSIKDGAITSSKLANNSVTTNKILDLTIDSTDFGQGARDYIWTHAASSVTINNNPDGVTIGNNTSGKLEVLDGAIKNSKLGNSAVDSNKIADNSISSSDIHDFAINTIDLADSIITSSKLRKNIITTENIVDNTITTNDIKDGGIKTDDIEDSSITTAKLSSDIINIEGRIISETHPIFNAVVNPMFLGDNPVEYFNDSQRSSCDVYVVDTIATPYGRYCLNMVLNTNSYGWTGQYIDLESSLVKPYLYAGSNVIFYGKVRKNGSISAYLQLYFLDNDYNILSSISTSYVTANGVWETCKASGTIPSNTRYLWLILRTTTGTVGESSQTCGWVVTNDKKDIYEDMLYVDNSMLNESRISELEPEGNMLMPDTIYAASELETNIYFNQIVTHKAPEQFFWDVNGSVGIQYKNRWSYTPAAETYTTEKITVNYYNDNFNLIDSASSIVLVKPKTLSSSKTVLYIGDSWVDNNEIGQELKNLGGSNLNFIGTQDTNTTSPNEGYGGKTYSWFENDPSSPFVNASGNVDLQNYLTTNGYSTPDMIIIQLGTNDITTYKNGKMTISNVNTIMAYVDSIITNFTADAPNSKIGICYIPGVASSQDAFGDDYGTDRARMWRIYNQNLFNRKLKERYGANGTNKTTNVTLIPINLNLDTKNNFPTTAEQYNSRNSDTYDMQSNALHPASSGYYQIADAIYGWIVNKQ